MNTKDFLRLGVPLGEATRRATNFVAKFILGGGDKTILESVEAGEDNAKESYQKAITGDLPENIAQIVRRQAASVQTAHDKVKNLRDEARAAA